MAYTGNLIHKFGLSKKHLDQMTGNERLRIIKDLRSYAEHLNVPLQCSIENEGKENQILWFDETHPKLDGFLMGYLMSLGFDENGERTNRIHVDP